MPERPHIFDLTPDQLRLLVVEWGLPKYRADQLLDWVYQKGIADPEAMTNLSKADRVVIAERLRFITGRIVRHQTATDGVQKLLIEWEGESKGSGGSLAVMNAKSLPQTECVMIPAEDVSGDRRTACISSQVGCPVGCNFCASGIGGLESNLTAGQIVEQVWQLSRLDEVERITNVVFMGMGEPLANFDEVVRAVRTLTAPWGMGISARKITVSTVGLPAQIRRLAEIDLPITLAISLHAPNDQVRKRIIPWAEFVSIDAILDAARYFFARTGREVTLEYILLHGVNDLPGHAKELASLAGTLRANVNLIRYNEVAGLPFARPGDGDVRLFQEILRSAGVNTHIRASRGRDIAAACGQLRHEEQAGNKTPKAQPLGNTPKG